MPAKRKKEPARAAKVGSRGKSNKESMVEGAPATSWANLWGIAGRSEIMAMRRLWQLRIPRTRHPEV
jgi:hypothetical protein